MIFHYLDWKLLIYVMPNYWWNNYSGMRGNMQDNSLRWSQQRTSLKLGHCGDQFQFYFCSSTYKVYEGLLYTQVSVMISKLMSLVMAFSCHQVRRNVFVTLPTLLKFLIWFIPSHYLMSWFAICEERWFWIKNACDNSYPPRDNLYCNIP